MKKTIIIHPILFSIFPILSLFNHNKDMAELSYLILPLTLSIFFSLILFLVINKIIKDKDKTALIASLFIVIFFTFGHLLPAITSINIGEFKIKNDFILAFLLAIVFIFSTLLIKSSKKNFKTTTKLLNRVAIVLVLMPLISTVIYGFKLKNLRVTDLVGDEKSIASANLTQKNSNALPDIYYIILDGYARQDVLEEVYSYDNSEFLEDLTNRGFYIADQARANYAQTYLSMSSALNFDYLNNLSVNLDENSSDRRLLKELIKNNKTFELLGGSGYKFVAFPSAWAGYYKNLKTDIYMHYRMDLNEFDNLLINSTPLRIIFGKNIQLNWVRSRLFYSFEHMGDITEIDSPTFTYAHFLIPHPPFLFDEHGNPIEPKGDVIGNDGSHYFKGEPTEEELTDYREKYIGQMKFLNSHALKMVDDIINNSPEPPIIILQADHGPGSETNWESLEKTNLDERLSILNAYYFPEKLQTELYETITPVNTFRLVINYLFNTDLPLLKDESYFSTWSKPYKFINVTDRLKPSETAD